MEQDSVRDDQRPTGAPAAATLSYKSCLDVAVAGRAGALRRGARVGDRSWEGRVLGDFILEEVLGEGGCGTVYRAEQRALGRAAVVKVIHRSLATRNTAAERFTREAQLASRFDHPYAAHVYAFGIEPDGVMWIAMELVDGIPLNQLLAQTGPQPLEHFVPLFERLCEVVQSAHDQGIVHRDIKPSNVMVIARAGRLMPKLLDFGLARLLPDGDPITEGTGAGAGAPAPEPGAAMDSAATYRSARELTHEGQLLGSPAYMAPEQWLAPTTAGPAADQYALALLAYESLTGARAFNGPTIEEIAEQHRASPLPALPVYVPAALHAVLARASDKIAERRFPSLLELANAMRCAALGATDGAALAPDIEIAPYPGLAAYSEADHASFVGRERDVQDVIDRLTAHSIVTIVGPSGSGKSSFLAAGLVPSLERRSREDQDDPRARDALERRWRARLVRPGSAPLRALAAVAEPREAPPYREAPRAASASSPAEIAEGLVAFAELRGVVLVVVVDQAEELFTMCAADDQRAAFADALALASSTARVRVVLALRDDFLWRIEQLPAWRGLLGRAVHVLGIPHRAELERMITEPARRRGFGFDDHALPREIADQVADRVGALPLVAFTVAQLWQHRDRRFRRLTRSAYERIGGVTGALVQHADSVVDLMSVADRRLVRLVFRRLITAEGARVLVSRTDLEGSLGAPSAAAVIDRLLAARLIVSRDDDTGDRIEVIHETLATTWPRLAVWRREDADGARLQEQLTVAARLWHERERHADLLWRGNALADLQRWQDGGDRNLTPVERAFARACRVRAGRVRRTRTALLALAFAVLIAGIFGLVSANREIAVQRATAVERLRASFEERGRAAIADGDDGRGMLYLAEASRLGARGRGFDLLASHTLVSLDAGLEIIGHRSAGVLGLEVGPTVLLTVDSGYTLSAWDRAGTETRLADGIAYLTLVGDLAVALTAQGDVVALDPRGRTRWRAERAVADSGGWSGIAGSTPARLIVAFSKAATLRDADSGRSRGELAHDSAVTAAAFAARGERVATGDSAGVVRIWNTATAALVATCASHAGFVRAIKFAPDAAAVVSGGNDGEVRICDTATGATLHRLVGHTLPVVTVDVAPDGRSIVSAGRDGKPRVWDARTGSLVRALEGHRGTVGSAQFSPDSAQILTLGFDGTARIWDREGTALGSLQGHAGQIFDGGWDVDGRHVITTSVDGAIRRWDPGRAIKLAVQRAHGEAITDLAVSPDDRWLLTAGDGRAILWDRKPLRAVTELAHDGKVRSAMFGPDGSDALTTDAAGNARIWQLPEGTLVARLGPGTTAATYAHSGEVITAGNGAVRFWSSTGVQRGAVALDYAASRLVVDPSGRWLFVQGQGQAPATESSVLVIDIAARAAVARLAISDHQVKALAADATRVAISDGTAIRMWQLGTWASLGRLNGHRSEVTALWLVSGRLVSASLDATLVWDRDARLAAKLVDTNRVFALAASPDGALFATTSSDGAIRVWDAASSRLLVQMPVHRLPAAAIQLTHDGAAAISAGNDGRLAIWDLAQRTRSAAELADIVRCRVPLRLEGDVALPRDLDFDDPKCRSHAQF
jgi:WD40 repeat protein/serine/threonine protein kinase